MQSFDPGGYCKEGAFLSQKERLHLTPTEQCQHPGLRAPNSQTERTPFFCLFSLPILCCDSLTNPNLFKENSLHCDDVKNSRLQNKQKKNVLQRNSKLVLQRVLAGSTSQLNEELYRPFLRHLLGNQTPTHTHIWNQTGPVYTDLFIHLIIINKMKDTFEESSGDHCWLLQCLKFIFQNYVYAHVYVQICPHN